MCRSVPANKGPMARGVQEVPVASVRPSAVEEAPVPGSAVSLQSQAEPLSQQL